MNIRRVKWYTDVKIQPRNQLTIKISNQIPATPCTNCHYQLFFQWPFSFFSLKKKFFLPIQLASMHNFSLAGQLIRSQFSGITAINNMWWKRWHFGMVGRKVTFRVPVARPSKCLNPRILSRTWLPSLKAFSSFLTSLSATSAAYILIEISQLRWSSYITKEKKQNYQNSKKKNRSIIIQKFAVTSYLH